MRPAYVAILFLLIGLAHVGFSYYKAGKPDGPGEISRRVRRKTGSIFILVAAGLVIFDILT